MQSPKEQLKALGLQVDELATDIGLVLLPPLLSLANGLKPVVAGVREFAQANPRLTRGLLMAAGGLVGLKTGITGLAFGFNFFVRTPLAQLRTGLSQVQAVWSILGAKSAMAGSVLGRVGSVFGKAGGFVVRLASVVGGKLASAMMIAGRAILFVGRALIMNPIGLIVMAIAGAAYLIYKYWEPIKGFFSTLWDGVKRIFSSAWLALKDVVSNVWESIKTAFDGGIAGISKLILDWSPLGLFYKAFAGVMDYFGVELPGSFSEFGGMLVSGLIDGITSMGSAVKDAIVGLGDSIIGWFTSRLDIHSPSRVFMELGGNVSEGAALGITNNKGLVRRATLDMAEATDVPLASPRWQDTLGAARLPPPVPRQVPAAPGAAAGPAMVVHFSPTIKIEGGAGDVASQVKQALRMSYSEFEALMRQWQERTGRRAYGGFGDPGALAGSAR